MSAIVGRYTIWADRDGMTRSASRCQAGSAMVLADRWAEQGWQNITLTDTEGHVRSREGFRLTLRLVRQISRRPALT